MGVYSKRKDGIDAVYFSRYDEELYDKPLYRESGTIFGMRGSKKCVLETKEAFLKMGYKLLEDN